MISDSLVFRCQSTPLVALIGARNEKEAAKKPEINARRLLMRAGTGYQALHFVGLRRAGK